MLALFNILADGASGHSTISGGTEAALIGGMIALVNVISELAKAAMSSLKARKNGGHGSEPRGCIVCQTEVHGIHETVTKTDVNGAPMIYASHALVERMTEATTELRNVAASQSRLLNRLEQGGKPGE